MMKKAIIVIIVIIILGLAGFVYYRGRSSKTIRFTNNASSTINTTPMTISSPAFKSGQAIPTKYTCDDAGVNPPLDIANVPNDAVSLALIMEDPDAPTGTWTHWIMWNIPPSTVQIPENSVPLGATVGQASSGQNVYGGPCPPPSNPHHYYFRLYALPAKLELSSFSDADALRKAMNGDIISEAELMGTYSRNN